AAARQMATLIVSNLLLNLMTGLLIPLVYLYITACAGAEATGNQGVGAIGGFIHWAVKTVLTWLLLLFTAYISISGVISGSADRAAVKLTRFAVSGMVPVVGGILSDATESVLVGAGLLRNTIGIYGTLAVLAFCILPFLRLGVQYLLYKIAAILTAAMTQTSLSKLIGEIGTAFGLVLAMTGTAAMVALISIITTISVAVG
ncbi:MAG: stage III sporulation protein AE, partial [Oscillospiraceae bacterium]|nr:stage III sporulation protein AE [Oscillospiraceae bacterium]